jgi:hypothetical protein
MRLVRLAQAAIQLQHVRDVFRGLVVGVVTADDEVFRLGFLIVLEGTFLPVMLHGPVAENGENGTSSVASAENS